MTTDDTAYPADSGERPGQPPLRLLRGDATAEELAALLAVLAAAGAPGAAGKGKPARHPSEWSSPERALRRIGPPGAGAWRASALPR
ncbi:acyl-CoA carboxylase epsilon subunit [Pedococcus sp. 5OH_020]|uniref:acyl-CoA carboxylase epsilon subunit n=1 Tax=Pedococcus sp. 5OH_020 TaxID=2989814 RepID=UPI0022E9D1E7|nr:acyl-CoA carboxylase epsilon subunit [Pedococcus sp. 5OH_020]